MRIAYLSGNRWPGREPGLSFSLHNARGFARAGAEFTLILPVSGPDPLGDIRETFYQGAEPPRIVPLSAPELMGSRFLFYVQAVRHLATTTYDVLVFRALTFLPWAARLRRWLGLPLWFEAHDFWTDPALRGEPVPRSRRRHVRLERRFLREVDGIVCVSEPQAELYRRYYPDVPVVTAETACKPPRAPRTGPFTHTLGYVGSFAKGKYPLELVLEALAETGDARLRLLGVGARDEGRRAELLAVARSLGLEERVELVGWAHGAELQALEARMDLGVACLAETFLNKIASPLKVLEYLAAGLPFVASRLPGIARLVEDGSEGFLVPNDARSWAAAVRRAYADPAAWARMSERCVEKAARHSWEARARTVMAALERALPAAVRT